MAAPGPTDPASGPVQGAVRAERRILLELWERHGGSLLLAFFSLLLPLWLFAELADEVADREGFAFDEPLLLWAQGLASEGLDRFFVVVTDLGYLHGVVPLDILLVLSLFAMRRLREATFAAVALGGSALLNMGTKLVFARERPSLWESITPELTYSFPSGHAMGSATLACVLFLLAWHTRWRWAAAVLLPPAVVLVGFSRIYLGVHYPSDILAGWAAASAWVGVSYFVLFRFHARPWQTGFDR